jgi:hypothetical protein
MRLTAKRPESKVPTRLLGAALAVFSVFAYNQWFRANLGPLPADEAPADFRILAVYPDQLVTMERKAGTVSTLHGPPDPKVETTPPWPTPRHGADRIAARWNSLLLENPAAAISAGCLEFDGRSALIYWNNEGELCALDGESGDEFLALTDLADSDTVLGPQYLSSRELAVLSNPGGGTAIHLDLLRLQWNTAEATLEFATRQYAINGPANAAEIYDFGMVRHEKGFGGYIAGPSPLNMLFSTREAGLVTSEPLPVSILSLSPDGTLAQIQTESAGDALARVDWLTLRLHTPEPMETLGHETFQWSPDSRYMIIGAQTQEGSYVRMYDVRRRSVVFSEALRSDVHDLPLGLWYSSGTAPASSAETPAK